jgi:hypothetical protein
VFGQLFRSVVDLPGFAHGDGGFLRFLTPGVVMMTALFSSAWAGTTYLEDIDRGVMDSVWAYLGLLAGAALVMGLLSTRAFRPYRKQA